MLGIGIFSKPPQSKRLLTVEKEPDVKSVKDILEDWARRDGAICTHIFLGRCQLTGKVILNPGQCRCSRYAN